MNKNFYAVIMAGGIGSRFWPVSRPEKPKQFIDIMNTGQTLFQTTYNRMKKVCPEENILIVTNERYANIIKNQIPSIKEHQILGEPLAKNTAPCVAYANYKIRQKNPDAVMIVAPSDHLIMEESTFLEVIKESMNFASKNNILITLGIKPHRPDTGYGYIQKNTEIQKGNFYKVERFTEKPNMDFAKKFVESGDFLWNSGIFVWSVKSITNQFESQLPEIHNIIGSISTYYTEKEKQDINRAYPDCPKISIDYGIMENAQNVYVYPVSFGWSDVGTWNAIYDLKDKTDPNQNVVMGKNVILRDTKNTMIKISEDKLLAVNGVDNLIIIESDNIILVADKSKEQEIKELVNKVEINKKSDKSL